jgi:RHS repeat-associated protein
VIASLDSSSGTLTKTGYQTYDESNVTTGTFRYTGGRIDAETNGLYDFRARVYSPRLGRILQRDPIGYGGGSNLYAYVNNALPHRPDRSPHASARFGRLRGDPEVFCSARLARGATPQLLPAILGEMVAGRAAVHLHAQYRAMSLDPRAAGEEVA